MSVEFTDNSVQIKGKIEDAVIAYLYEAGGELEAQVKRNSRVDSGQLKGSWTYRVDEAKGEAVVGSPLENAIWEEFGTGEYAVHEDGRMGGWSYMDDEGKWHHTYGKKPNRALLNAFETLKTPLTKRAESLLKARFK